MDTITSIADSYITEFAPAEMANIAAPSLYYVTPTRIAKAYNFPAADGHGVKVGIISLGGGWLQSDLAKSMTDLGVKNYPASIPSVTINGAVPTWTAGGADVENTLDIYCIAGLVPRANIVMYSAPNDSISFSTNPASAEASNSGIGFASAINKAIDDGCDVISISWGSTEKIISGNIAYYCGDYMKNIFAKAAAQGVTVCIASGDYGSAAVSSINYPSIQYPAGNSNITAVGGTLLTTNADDSRLTEASYASSGGGVSDWIAKPAYQEGWNYKTYNSTTGVTSANIALTTRGVPDVSAPFTSYPMYFNGSTVTVSGTSASAPIIAGFIARLVQLTGRRLGNINPFMYLNYSTNMFYDLYSGTDTVTSTAGYSSQAGWDPITGLGVPHGLDWYTKLKSSASSIFPAASTGFRPKSGPTYPRRTTGAR